MSHKYPNPDWKPRHDMDDSKDLVLILFFAACIIAGGGIITALIIKLVMTLCNS